MAAPKTPLLTVDIIIRQDGHPRGVLLIERRHAPLGWALPGGFVDVGERVEDAARREAYEETGLAVTLEALLGCYSDPGRDPRGHTVSLVYVARASGVARAGDDARSCQMVDIDHITVPLVFDHARIVHDYRRFCETGERPAPEPSRR
ncbi:NUDIX hydrolase [Acidiferrobacter sp.]|uniref:NUDIX hydrolase n=1 Tax=Acidiferrobacter sp. TaxID=1872107 RepID=UPI002624DF63|nr:NUDIX hydrolase [Acidiferrobacter sp.]